MPKSSVLLPDSVDNTPILPKIKSVHPHGSKILVEILGIKEILGTKLHIGDNEQVDGAPQAYIIEIGPCLDKDSGLKVGQRVYWSGKGTQVQDPNANFGRVRALLEISNILAIIEE